MNRHELEQYLWGAATILRGLVDAGDYKQFIFPLVFYKRLSDVWDEDFARALEAYGGAEDLAKNEADERFKIPEGAHWTQVRAAARDVGRAIQNAMRAIEAANPGKLDGIFGDAPWTNKERLPDSTLKNLLEHFSSQVLSIQQVPEDSMGDGYEFLVGKFADDGGNTAQEFYTNRTLVHLMAQMLRPQAGESIYDPTCGTGGMLLSALAEVKRAGGEHRTLRLYGQERNHMTSSIARMNLVLHGVEDFDVQRGDTLERPCFIQGDRLRTFDVVLANPPYSIKRWNREAWSSDAWGRNFLGTPPQGRADYAFFQHILKSLDPTTGRCAILFPHGVLFRKEEAEMRKKLVDADLVECVLGLGPNLFFNSPMEACVVFCRARKAPDRRGRILFIDAVEEIERERAYSYLKPEHQRRVRETYERFETESGFAAVATLEQVAAENYSLSIPLYVPRPAPAATVAAGSVTATVITHEWREEGTRLWRQMDKLVPSLRATIREAANG
ncbi:MAG: SAM-dependent DNA methyltransferase [Myxococcales bacterium]|nr:SAM-dependent DNA methyltransferase [Myxococcales bacterium]